MLFLAVRRLLFLLLCYLPLGCNPVKNKQLSGFQSDTSLCDFTQGYCRQISGDVTVDLQITPHNTPSEMPLTVSVKFSNKVTNVTMTLTGRDMFMGVIPIKLILSNNQKMVETNQQSDNHTIYGGEFIFGSCSSGYMVWQINLAYQTDTGTKQALFYFLADSHS